MNSRPLSVRAEVLRETLSYKQPKAKGKGMKRVLATTKLKDYFSHGWTIWNPTYPIQ